MFKFKRFSVNQHNAPFKIGTDGILLGAWCDVQNVSRALDIGTGTGIIAMMLAQRTNSPVIGLEINPDAHAIASKNFKDCCYASLLSCVKNSVQQYSQVNTNKFDLLVSNPPYFINSLKSKETGKSIARHDASLNQEDLIKASISLLSEKGKLCVIYPVEEGKRFIEQCRKRHLFLTKETKVYPNPNKPEKRLLLEFSRINKSIESDSITIETGKKRHDYTEEYKRLTNEFYIIF